MYSAWHPIVGECVSEGARRSGKTRLEWINDALREYKDGQLKQYRGYLESIIPDMRDELLSESYGVDGGGADDEDGKVNGSRPRKDSFLRMSSAYYDTIAGMPSPVQVGMIFLSCVAVARTQFCFLAIRLSLSLSLSIYLHLLQLVT